MQSEYPDLWDRFHEEETIEIDVDPLPQSSGHVLDGGDCGFCCLAGILGLPSILAAYELLESRMPNDDWKKRSSLCINRLELFLKALDMPSDEYDPPFHRYKKGLYHIGARDGRRRYIWEGHC